MAGSASDAGSGAVKGAALGAPLGPWGMAGGAVVGGVYGYLSGGPSDAEKAAAAANAEHIQNAKNNAIALENYRQNSRDQYHNLLTAETTPYQGYSNTLAAMTGSGMSTAGLSASENPLSLRDTGVGAPEGSNYAGWSTYDGRRTVQHQGIGAYLDGTNVPEQGAHVEPTGPGSTRVVSTVAADPYHSAQVNDTSLNPTYNPNSMAVHGGGPGPGAGLQFMPRKAP